MQPLTRRERNATDLAVADPGDHRQFTEQTDRPDARPGEARRGRRALRALGTSQQSPTEVYVNLPQVRDRSVVSGSMSKCLAVSGRRPGFLCAGPARCATSAAGHRLCQRAGNIDRALYGNQRNGRQVDCVRFGGWLWAAGGRRWNAVMELVSGPAQFDVIVTYNC